MEPREAAGRGQRTAAGRIHRISAAPEHRSTEDSSPGRPPVEQLPLGPRGCPVF